LRSSLHYNPYQVQSGAFRQHNNELFFYKGDNVLDTIKKCKQKIAAQRASNESLLTDITDGAEYVKLYQSEGFLSCPSNISFIVNTGKCA